MVQIIIIWYAYVSVIYYYISKTCVAHISYTVRVLNTQHFHTLLYSTKHYAQNTMQVYTMSAYTMQVHSVLYTHLSVRPKRELVLQRDTRSTSKSGAQLQTVTDTDEDE